MQCTYVFNYLLTNVKVQLQALTEGCKLDEPRYKFKVKKLKSTKCTQSTHSFKPIKDVCFFFNKHAKKSSISGL